ncbi:MAG TPA: hypothetical protein VKK79_21055 [Candidatus Lokiarchaeia archaeon]|nr:hypothetical protein [Candidatus Lokiarchaeia archaeon]
MPREPRNGEETQSKNLRGGGISGRGIRGLAPPRGLYNRGHYHKVGYQNRNNSLETLHTWWASSRIGKMWKRQFGYGSIYGSKRFNAWLTCCICVSFLIVFPLVFLAIGFTTPVLQNSQTLYISNSWSIPKYLPAGSQITFAIQSPTPVSVIVSDQPLSSMPKTAVTESVQNQTTASGYQWFFEELYLTAGTTLNCSYNVSAPVDFFIVDAGNYSTWVTSNVKTPFYENASTANGTGINVAIPAEQNYFVVWYNYKYANDVDLNFTVQEFLVVLNYSSALYQNSAITSLNDAVTVPTEGNWYFIIYFDPRYPSPTTETAVASYHITFGTGGNTPVPSPYSVDIIVFAIIAGLIVLAMTIFESKRLGKSSQ